MILVIQWLHVLLGIFWFGGSLYLNFMVVPVVLFNSPKFTSPLTNSQMPVEKEAAPPSNPPEEIPLP